MKAILQRWQRQVRSLKTWTVALYLACRDPRAPWPARLVAGFTVAYLLSPIDLIPDFIPVLGYLDDLIVVPLAIALAIRLMPKDLLDDCRKRAALIAEDQPSNRWAAACIIAIWLAGAAWLLRLIGGP